MQITFKGMAIAQKEYTSKSGNKGNQITFLDIQTQKQFSVSSRVAVDDKQLYQVFQYVLEGVLALGKNGLYLAVDKIAGK